MADSLLLQLMTSIFPGAGIIVYSQLLLSTSSLILMRFNIVRYNS